MGPVGDLNSDVPLYNNVPDVTPCSSAVDWFVLCPGHDTRKMFRYHLFPNAFLRFVMFFVQYPFTHMFMDVGNNMHVRIICNVILLCVAFHGLSMSINVVHAIVSLRLIAFAPFPSAYINQPRYSKLFCLSISSSCTLTLVTWSVHVHTYIYSL